MTELAIALGIVLVIFPAVLGWAVLLLGLRESIQERRKRRWSDAQTDAWVRAYNAQLVTRAAAKRTPATRKQALRAIVGGRTDPPRAA